VTETEIMTNHLDAARADAARQARDLLLAAVRTWTAAPKYHVGAVALPADPHASRAFATLFSARWELARHVGGEAAALVTAAALAEASGASDSGE
jgi:hypothetical protein